ncbi:MAG TPA: thiamine diphosphokinase [Candidatus Saccharimonadales bacterium]|nr:thiamine diphosphokinase [Candidatus Saccharimonadales bacterium]
MKAVIVAGGEPLPADKAQLVGADLLVAADAGARWLIEAEATPDLLVGDLDSIPADVLAELEAAGIPIEQHARDKDASDAELAVDRAVAGGADQVVMIGALGGERLDHELANLLLLAGPTWPATLTDLSIVRGGTRVRALHGGGWLELNGAVGDLVTLLPLAGDAEGVRTEGLRYPLRGEALRFGRSRGLSNVVERAPGWVSLERGTLLVIEISGEGESR